MARSTKNETKETPFEEILEKLEGVVARLEEGDLPLEQSLAVFEEGIRLSRLGAERLDDAERRVDLLLAEEDGVKTVPLPEVQKD
ncbi:MAG: exodeoxyribonuclease VII small subunit [Myxococcales bacterium]|nr:exodeoxyribonuclease VII small subunit [Myxococcales bacterium]